MDIGTVLGLFLAWGALVACLVIENGNVSELFNPSAFVLVVGGTLGATIAGLSIRQLFFIPAALKQAVWGETYNLIEMITVLVEYARKARRHGVLALEEDVKHLNNPFLKKGLQLIIDGTPSEMVREVMETEIVAMQERHKVGENIFATLGGFSPTLGIIGTVMGLINMLARLNEPGKMGGAIASAFVATLYGVAFANLLYIPIGNKLRAKTNEEVIAFEMITEGVLSIQAGDNPRIVELKMLAFLPPDQRVEYSSSYDARQAA